MKKSSQKLSLCRPVTYQIKVQGHLDQYWSEWFDGLTVTYDEEDDTLLTGQVADQAALHGLLKKVRDLGLALISVNPVESRVPTTSKGRG
jgi:hypothetical protein